MQSKRFSLCSSDAKWWAVRSARGFHRLHRPGRARSARPTFGLNRYGYATRVQGRDYDVLGWPRRRLGLALLLVIGAGTVMLVRTRRREGIESGSTAAAPAIS